MVNNISVTNYLGETLSMDLRDPEKSGFLIYNITGLGPNKATINSTEMSTNDGSVYNSARVESRNIVLSIVLLEQPDVETTRHKLYRYFPIKKKLRLTFKNDSRECYIDGYVESNEIPLFVPQENAQISIICPDPYFYSIEQNITEFFSVSSGFEFPFPQDDLEGDMLEFGIITDDVNRDIYYDGDGEVGMNITIHATGSVTNLSIYNTETKEFMKISSKLLTQITGSDIVKGDDIIISTITGNKYIVLLRNGKKTNILNALDRQSDWFKLSKGDNIFAYTADYGSDNLQFTILNPVMYEGV